MTNKCLQQNVNKNKKLAGGKIRYIVFHRVVSVNVTSMK